MLVRYSGIFVKQQLASVNYVINLVKRRMMDLTKFSKDLVKPDVSLEINNFCKCNRYFFFAPFFAFTFYCLTGIIYR